MLQRLEHELIDRRKVRLARHECFALLTPLIDEFIQQLRATADDVRSTGSRRADLAAMLAASTFARSSPCLPPA